jgi:hypothetical protein
LLLSESSVSEIIRSLNQLPGLVSIPQLPSGKPLFNEGGAGLFNALFFEVSLKCHRSQNKRAGGKIWDSNLGKCVNL